MSRVVPGGRTPSRKLGSGNARQPKPRRRYDDDENMSKVHQDEDYGKNDKIFFFLSKTNLVLHHKTYVDLY